MPPKIYRKNNPSTSSPKADQPEVPQLPEPYDVNPKHIVQNTHTIQKVHTLTSILGSIVAGLFCTDLYSGIFVYLAMHLLVTLVILGAVRDVDRYFMKKGDLFLGLGAGVPVYMCGWIIMYNLVYIL